MSDRLTVIPGAPFATSRRIASSRPESSGGIFTPRWTGAAGFVVFALDMVVTFLPRRLIDVARVSRRA